MPEINQLTASEAIEAAHCLHKTLVFAATGSGGAWDISPSLMPDDAAAVCKANPGLASGELKHTCNRCSVRMILKPVDDAGCPSIYVSIPTQAEAQLLAAELNTLYGI